MVEHATMDASLMDLEETFEGWLAGSIIELVKFAVEY
jgi:hypothetical protein